MKINIEHPEDAHSYHMIRSKVLGIVYPLFQFHQWTYEVDTEPPTFDKLSETLLYLETQCLKDGHIHSTGRFRVSYDAVVNQFEYGLDL
jgi:hypothetical protein